MIRRLIIITYFLLVTISTIAQSGSDQKPDITFYINFLENSQYIDTLSLENIFILNRRSDLRKVYIQTLRSQEKSIQRKISKVQGYINNLEKDLDRVKHTYAQMLVFTYLYKKFFPSNLIFVLSAKSFNQAYLRIKFLQLSTKYLKSLTKVIYLTKQELENQKQILEKSLAVRRSLIKKIKYQQSVLEEEYAMLEQIKQNTQQYEALLEDLKNYELVRNELNRTVLNEINIDKAGFEAEKITSLFYHNKGLLKPPLENALIVIPFGVHEHPKLKSIKVRNDGIDITSLNDTIVKVVFAGKVTNIISLPNKRRAVLVNHGDYYTVYSNLYEVFVNPGQKLNAGQSIGTIHRLQGEEYPILNFQIWHKSQKLNPEDWLNI